ncbi:MAG: hypothetical protein L3V56_01960 [Candidatus Magnetoovum sp. WYHC-5]|nr:hypothetical protein [Candidatus Magnetoovum sp. WYHC-5]
MFIKYRIFLSVVVLELVVLFALFVHHHYSLVASEQIIKAKRQVVQTLTLTDLSIWTEARYTRHPSQADFFSAFGDFPASFEHFPAGSIVAPTKVQ